jgi:arylformamidase
MAALPVRGKLKRGEEKKLTALLFQQFRDAPVMLHDISTPLDAATPIYPGDAPFQRRIEAEITTTGDGYNLSSITMSAHCGTHVDAPSHFIAGGACIDEIPVQRWLSTALLLEVTGEQLITRERLEAAALVAGESLLLKANHDRAADADADNFRALSLDAAEYAAGIGVNLIGIDALSIEHYHDPSFPVHHTLLEANVLILEGLRLSRIRPGRYTLIVAPLLISGSDGAPARAFLQDM